MAEGKTLADVHPIVQTQGPDVLLIDLEFGVDSALPSIRSVTRTFPNTHVIAVSMYSDQFTRDEVLMAGGRELVSKVRPIAELIEVIESVMQGWLTTPSSRSSVNSPLTQRELAVLQLLRLGLKNRQVADRLNIAEGTVRRHVSSVLRKLKASTRGEAVLLAVRLGIL